MTLQSKMLNNITLKKILIIKLSIKNIIMEIS